MAGGGLNLPPLYGHSRLYLSSKCTLNTSEVQAFILPLCGGSSCLPRELPESRGHSFDETREAVLSHGSEHGLGSWATRCHQVVIL